MRRLLFTAIALLLPAAALAALKPGDAAPLFTTPPRKRLVYSSPAIG